MQIEATKQLSMLIDSQNHDAVLSEGIRLMAYWYKDTLLNDIRRAFARTCILYEGGYGGFLECRTDYHDLNHSLDVFLAAARLLDGWAIERGALDEGLARALLIGALLHDSGYIQTDDDAEGTGAKYTFCHVERSMDFTKRHASDFLLSPLQAASAARMIAATSISAKFEDLPYESEEERWAGAMMATADLVGQMADRKYLEKLLFLYYEFKEAGFAGYDSSFDMLKKTRGFYDMIRSRFDSSWQGAYRLTTHHFRERYGIDENLYIEAIERQMAYLDKIIADDTTNFRKKLKRIDLEHLPIEHYRLS